jgi:hypothetical protein
MYFLLGQMEMGREAANLCPLVGFGIVVTMIIIWSKLTYRKPGCKAPKRNPTLLIAGLISTALFLVWLALAIENYYFEPQMDDTQAAGIVENLPEVRSFIEAEDSLKIPRKVRWTIDGRSLDLGNHRVKYLVGDYDAFRGRVTKVWEAFSVNLIDGSVCIWVDQDGGKWIPIEQWRKSGGKT